MNKNSNYATSYRPIELAPWYHQVILFFKKEIFSFSIEGNVLIMTVRKELGSCDYIISRTRETLKDSTHA